MKIVENPARPSVCATEEVFVYPQPSTLNYGSSRPNTMLYGTAPYMAGKGAPAQYIETSDRLRPQSTSQFNKVLARTYEQNLFPLQDVHCKLPLETQRYEPASTRAEVQNSVFSQRYLQ
jgi:hypothetical protein